MYRPHEALQPLLEGFALGVQIDEDQTPESINGESVKTELGLVELVELLRLWDPVERAVQAIVPEVIRTGERALAAFAVGNFAAPVAADVVKRVKLALLVPRQDYGMTTELQSLECPWVGQFLNQTNKNPSRLENSLPLAFEPIL